ncbi:unnamed protein product [Linum tenue]|uniref:Uncharacterized protein n=1 Tax=Linum tenue TaxID=586396 RepID=A0AAV0PAG8_9ROSI|nr:unnamed protein product [Linum tenue]
MDVNYASPAAGGDSNNSQRSSSSSSSGGGDHFSAEEEMISELRRGPWTVEEDFKLINYIAAHGEGRWNSLARCAGLKRTGKSCRLRWLNYLRPDVRRGNITLEEQLMILELHSRWGNRWSKIAQHLPGRTDNEIKNYWRTRVQKHAKQLKCDVNSKQFKDTMRYLWMPRLVERIQASGGGGGSASTSGNAANSLPTGPMIDPVVTGVAESSSGLASYGMGSLDGTFCGNYATATAAENSSTAASSADSFGNQVSPVSDMTTDHYNVLGGQSSNMNSSDYIGSYQGYTDQLISPATNYYNPVWDQQFQAPQQHQNNEYYTNNSNQVQWMDGGNAPDSLWNTDDIWFLQQQFSNNNINM